MPISLRNYQVKLVEQVRSAIRAGNRRVLIQSPTGSGKTALTAHIISSAAAKGKRCWFVNHRREILSQSVETLRSSATLELGIIAAGHPMNPFASTQVCSIDTLRRRLDKLASIPPDILVVDEAHHSSAATWTEVIRHFPNAILLGLTATPRRLNGAGFTDLFDVLTQGPSTADLISQGYLSDYILYRPSNVDLSGVHTVAGDFNQHELSERMTASTVTGDAVSTYLQRAHGKRGILFAWSIQSSKDFAAAFVAAGVPAEHVDGGTKDRDRDAAMKRFRAGDTMILTNCELFGEGLDVPGIEVVIMCRPTQSLGLYLQQIGRGLRVAEGKDRAVILDHAGNSFRHGLPDDPHEWTLEGRGKVSKRDATCPVRQCMKCYAIVTAASRTCKWCGWEFIADPRQVDIKEGELEAVRRDEAIAREAVYERIRDANERRSAKTLDDLREIGRRKGYRPSWADHVYNARLAKGRRRANAG